MKKLLFAGMILMLFVSCGNKETDKKAGNPYLGSILELQVEENDAYEKYQKTDYDEPWYYSDEKKVFEDKMAEELKSLKGVRMPCISGQPEIFSVVGDVAIFGEESYQVLLEFKRPVYSLGDIVFTVQFNNAAEGKTYGSEQQILFNRTILVDGWRYHKVTNYHPGDCRYQDFFINSIQFEDAKLFQKKVDQAVIRLEDSITVLENDSERDYYFPENMAVQMQEAFYNAIVSDDMEEYYGIDYGFGEMELDSEDDWNYFNKAYELWKSIYPDKWKVIKDFRKQKMQEGNLLCAIDVDDPA